MAEEFERLVNVVDVSYRWFQLGRVVEGLSYILPTVRFALLPRVGNWPKVLKFLDKIDERYAEIRELLKRCDFSEIAYFPLDAKMEVLMQWVDVVRTIVAEPGMTKRQAEAKIRELGVRV